MREGDFRRGFGEAGYRDFTSSARTGRVSPVQRVGVHLADPIPVVVRARRAGLIVAHPRLIYLSRPSPRQSSVSTVAPRVVQSTPSSCVCRSGLPMTSRRTWPDSRPTAPAGRWRRCRGPDACWPGVVGGASGSGCGVPFPPNSGPSRRPWPRHPQQVAIHTDQGAALEPMPQCEQLDPVAPQLLPQPGGRVALGQAAEDQQDLGRAGLLPLEVGPGPGVGAPPTSRATIIRGPGHDAGGET